MWHSIRSLRSGNAKRLLRDSRGLWTCRVRRTARDVESKSGCHGDRLGNIDFGDRRPYFHYLGFPIPSAFSLDYLWHAVVTPSLVKMKMKWPLVSRIVSVCSDIVSWCTDIERWQSRMEPQPLPVPTTVSGCNEVALLNKFTVAFSFTSLQHLQVFLSKLKAFLFKKKYFLHSRNIPTVMTLWI